MGLGQPLWVQHMGMGEGRQQGGRWVRAQIVLVTAQGLQGMPGAQSREGWAVCRTRHEIFPRQLLSFSPKASDSDDEALQ